VFSELFISGILFYKQR